MAETIVGGDGKGVTESATASAVKEVMPENLWKKIYGSRNGQLVLLYTLEGEGFNKVIGDSREISRRLSKDNLIYETNDSRRVINSWGSFVEYAAIAKLDLSGLTLSPEQKKYFYEYELQNKYLKGGLLDFAVLDGMDFTNTVFTGAELREASLKKTTGKATNFGEVKGYLLDLSGSSYNSPNFTRMNAPRSIHFQSTYEMPTFGDTNWTSGRLIGTRFFMKKNSPSSLDVSSAIMGACLFYGMETKPTSLGLKYSLAAFPGSCFYNLIFDTEKNNNEKADFSPLHWEDTRLTAEEREFIKKSGQWLNSPLAMDGVKVSPDVAITLDPQRIYTMFSEMVINVPPYNREATLFFSKGQILMRSSFHECAAIDINDILPLGMRQNPPNTAAAVVEEVAPVAPPVVAKAESALGIPELAFDKDKAILQIEALKMSSVADSLAIGGALQTKLIEASQLLTSWAMSNLAKKPLQDTLDKLTGGVQKASLKPFLEPPPAPPLPPPPPPQSAWSRFVNGPIKPPAPPVIKAPPNEIAPLENILVEFPDNLQQAMKDNTSYLSNAEKLKKYLQTLQDAFAAYVDGLNREMPVIVEKNADAASIIEVRRKSLEASLLTVTAFKENVSDIVNAAGNDGATYQWLQGVSMPALTQQFSKAATLYQLAMKLGASADQSVLPEDLAGFYKLVIDDSSTQPPRAQLQTSFAAAQKDILDNLEDVHEALVKIQRDRAKVLKSVLGLG